MYHINEGTKDSKLPIQYKGVRIGKLVNTYRKCLTTNKLSSRFIIFHIIYGGEYNINHWINNKLCL